jgi:hypothetical protein
MKKFMLLVGLVGTFALTAVGASQAAVVSHENNVPLSFTTTNPCNGDTVTLTGTFDDVVRMTTSASGRVDFGSHFAIDASGVGAPSGATYLLHEEGNSHDNNFTFVNGAASVNQVDTFHVISQGSAPNFLETLLFHETITPDGTITSMKFDVTDECRG